MQLRNKIKIQKTVKGETGYCGKDFVQC